MIGVVLVLAVGCGGGSITVRRAERDTPGFRYYLPRPFLAVKREIPWTTEDTYIQGALVEQSGAVYLSIDPADITRLGLDPAPIPATALYHDDAITTLQGSGGTKDTSSTSGSKSSSSSTKGSSKSSTATAPTTDKTSTDPSTDTAKPDKSASAGSSSADDTSSDKRTATATGLVSIVDGPISVVYLPDFDEQYAIDIKSSGSVTDVKLQLDNGWMLSAVDQKIDNTAMTQLVATQIDKTLDVARSLASLKLGLPGAGSDDTKLHAAGGTRITVRIRTIEYVTPGMYPLLKVTERPIGCHEVACWFSLHTRKERIFEALPMAGTATGVSHATAPASDQISTATVILKPLALTVKSVTTDQVTVESAQTLTKDVREKVRGQARDLLMKSDPWRGGVSVVFTDEMK
jgi:hypothetical protein